MTTTIVYETDTGIVLACGNVVVDYSAGSVSGSEGEKLVRGGNFDTGISVLTTAESVPDIRPLDWIYHEDTNTFEYLPIGLEGLQHDDE